MPGHHLSFIQTRNREKTPRLRPTHLLLRLHVELVPRNELQDVVERQRQELLGHGDLHEVLVDEAVGSVVEHRAHHGLRELPYAQAVLGVKPGNRGKRRGKAMAG